MTIETIKGNIDRKILRLMTGENLNLSEISNKLNDTKTHFEKLLAVDINSNSRLHMLTMFNAFSEKRINDIDWVLSSLSCNEYFAGASDAQLFELVKLRDKVSQDVLEAEFY